jgi:hypothetical protein
MRPQLLSRWAKPSICSWLVLCDTAWKTCSSTEDLRSQISIPGTAASTPAAALVAAAPSIPGREPLWAVGGARTRSCGAFLAVRPEGAPTAGGSPRTHCASPWKATGPTSNCSSLDARRVCAHVSAYPTRARACLEQGTQRHAAGLRVEHHVPPAPCSLSRKAPAPRNPVAFRRHSPVEFLTIEAVLLYEGSRGAQRPHRRHAWPSPSWSRTTARPCAVSSR